jgi:hypothetical protein
MENGVMLPSDLFSNSDEAFVLVTLEGNYVWWRNEAKLLRTAGRKLSQVDSAETKVHELRKQVGRLE